MAKIGSAGRGVPGATVVKASRRFNSENSHKPDELQFQPAADECIVYSRLDPERVRAIGADRFPPNVLGVVR